MIESEEVILIVEGKTKRKGRGGKRESNKWIRCSDTIIEFERMRK
jgi:hypothetical protein